eukprot:5143552-Pyramimonas_sp.AAC.1
MFWELDFDDFCQHAQYARDSCPGPDGIPYSAWFRGGTCTMEPLFEMYQALLAHGRLPDAFNHGTAVFLPKGDAPSDAVDAVFRPPEQTRPITLGNSENKLIS